MPASENKSKAISGRGGRREGAGRKPGVPNKATAELKAIAQQYTDKAVKALADIVQNSDSDAARVSAANALLDRGWGKPTQGVEHTGANGEPIKHLFELSDAALMAIAAKGA